MNRSRWLVGVDSNRGTGPCRLGFWASQIVDFQLYSFRRKGCAHLVHSLHHVMQKRGKMPLVNMHSVNPFSQHPVSHHQVLSTTSS